MPPLSGKTIVVTRAQASELVSRLSGLGAECVACPTIRILPPEDMGPLDQAIHRLPSFHWLLFTSPNGVTAFFQRLFTLGEDIRALGHLRTACVGPGTADRLRTFGLESDRIPEHYEAASMAESFAEEEIRGRNILIPQGDKASPALACALRRFGANVSAPTAYRTVPEDRAAEQLKALRGEGRVDMITFASPSAAKNFRVLFSDTEFREWIIGTATAAIGPVTAAAMEACGMTPSVTAQVHTISGFCDAICNYYESLKQNDLHDTE